jgi:hypothetical protein
MLFEKHLISRHDDGTFKSTARDQVSLSYTPLPSPQISSSWSSGNTLNWCSLSLLTPPPCHASQPDHLSGPDSLLVHDPAKCLIPGHSSSESSPDCCFSDDLISTEIRLEEIGRAYLNHQKRHFAPSKQTSSQYSRSISFGNPYN